jgi:hypothetical protein
MARALTHKQQDAALAVVAKWLGPKMGYEGPAPTGPAAAFKAEGPVLNRTWQWSRRDTPTPTILLEGGPYDWAVVASLEDEVVAELSKLGVHAEPYAGWALCLYPEER